MSDINHRPEPDDVLDQAIGALRAVPVPAGPPAEVVASTVGAIESRLAGITPAGTARDNHRRRVMRYIRYGTLATAAAVLVGVAGGVLWSPRESAAAEFQRAMANARKAESMTARIRYTRTDAAAKGKESVTKLYVSGQRVRMESLNPGGEGYPDLKTTPVLTVNVYDLEELKQLTVSYRNNQYLARDMDFRGDVPDVLSQFRGVADDAIEALGQEKVGGTAAKAYRVRARGLVGPLGKAADVRVWIDPATDLPVRIRVADAGDPGTGEWREWVSVYDEFAWNVKLADDLFSLTPPKGVQPIPANPPRPKGR